MRQGRLRGRLAAALALGTAAAVPTVVAFSEDPRSSPSYPWAAGSGGSGGSGAAAPASWSLSRVVEDFLEKVQQPGVDREDLEDDWGAGEGRQQEALAAAEEAAAAAAAAQAAAPGAAPAGRTPPDAAGAAMWEQAGAAGPAAGQAEVGAPAQQQQQQAGRQRMKFRRVHDVSPALLAAQHAGEMRHMRQLAAAELARLDAASGSAADQQQQQQQQRPRAKRRWGGTAAAAEPPPPPGLPPAAAAAAVAGTPGGGAAAGSGSGPAGGAAAQAPPPQQQLPPLLPRFTDAELMRFAIMHGLLRAGTAAERRQALREGAAAAARTAAWLRGHPFCSEEELQRFGHLVQWRGCDGEGRPILHISIGRAVMQCPGAAALAFANAVITQMERGVRERLWDGSGAGQAGSGGSGGKGGGSCSEGGGTGNNPAPADACPPGSSQDDGSGSSPPAASPSSGSGSSDSSSSGSGSGSSGSSTSTSGSGGPGGRGGAAPRPEQVIVVMDCSGASTLSAARMTRVFQAVAATLNHHYPGRLHELVLLDMPVVLGWMVSGIKQLVHPDTRHKFRVVPHGQPRPGLLAAADGTGGPRQEQAPQAEQRGRAAAGSAAAAAGASGGVACTGER